MSLTRRTLLQQTSLALTSFGLGQMGLSLLARRHQRVLATPTSRKLALLIGINSYPDSVYNLPPQGGPALHGAVNDVDLVRELLIARFGFNPADIITLRNKQASREAIEAALQFHLLDQVTSNDVVLFHFSGIGSYVQLNNELPLPSGVDKGLQLAMVPVDGHIPKKASAAINDIMLATLTLFLGALPTQNIVSTLDFGFAASASLLGNLRVRSRFSIAEGILADRVFELHQYLQPQQKADFPITAASSAVTTTAMDSWPGLLISSASDHGIAVEAPWGGFSAGLLTYLLTQRLWWFTPKQSIHKDLGQVASAVESFVGSQYRPAISGLDKFSDYKQSGKKLGLSTLLTTQENADGVVWKVDSDQTLHLWMAGLPALIVQHCLTPAYVRLLSSSGPRTQENSASPYGQIWSRDGLTVKAKTYELPGTNSSSPSPFSMVPGMLVHEAVRMIPRNIGLMVALGNGLERIERVDATSSLSSIPGIKLTTVGEQQVDCVFDNVRTSDVPSAFSATIQQEDMPDSSGVPFPPKGVAVAQLYGLFRPGRNLIPATNSSTEEAVKTAIRRVTPQFYNLLAEKLLQLTVNNGSSCLGGWVSLEVSAQSPYSLGQQYTSRSVWQVPEVLPVAFQQQDNDCPTVTVGTQIQCRLQNYSDRPCYCLLVNTDSGGGVTVLHPLNVEQSGEPSALDAVILPGAVVTVPAATSSFPWTIGNPPGVATVYVIMSCSPFTETITQLAKLVPSADTMHRPQNLAQPLPIVQSILQDLHRASHPNISQLGIEVPGDRYGLSVDCWATFSFTYRVVTGNDWDDGGSQANSSQANGMDSKKSVS